jgi:hypothetical protein
LGRGHDTATITDFDPRVDTLQYSGDLNVHRYSDHRGGTVLRVGSETVNLPGVSPDETLRINDGTVGPVRHHEQVSHNHEHDHHDDLFF